MWMLLRVPKMNGAIFGFQRCDWWPKCAPASRRPRIEYSGSAIICLSPVETAAEDQALRVKGHRVRALRQDREIRVWNGRAYRRQAAGKQGSRKCFKRSARDCRRNSPGNGGGRPRRTEPAAIRLPAFRQAVTPPPPSSCGRMAIESIAKSAKLKIFPAKDGSCGVRTDFAPHRSPATNRRRVWLEASASAAATK